MTARQQKRMTVDEFLVWARGRQGRYELHNGVVYPMSPERAGHAEVKHAVATALATGIARAKLECWMLPDGMTVRVDKHTAHEPDALVYCGSKLLNSAVEVPSPVIVVEVLSPSTRHIDASAKLAGYFKVPSVCHYLIVDPERHVVIHHSRGEKDLIGTRIVSSGTLVLAPPGMTINIARLFASPLSRARAGP
jgi:Uma2 family endonuclease